MLSAFVSELWTGACGPLFRGSLGATNKAAWSALRFEDERGIGRNSARTHDQKRANPMAANRQPLWLIRIQGRDHLVVFGHRGDWLLIDFFDHVPFLQLRDSAVRIDIGNNHP